LKVIDDFKRFWKRQSENYKVFVVRDVLGRLFGVGGGGGGVEAVAEVVNTGTSSSRDWARRPYSWVSSPV
jgi:hypothetical protein